MKTFAILLLLAIQAPAQSCLNMDLVLVADYSGSMEHQEDRVFAALTAMAHRFSDDKNVRVGITIFNDQPYLIHDLSNNYNSVSDALYQVTHVPQGSTYMGVALQHAGDMLMADRYDAHKVIVLISDGAPSNMSVALETSATLQRQGVLIASVFVSAARVYVQEGQYRLEMISSPGYAVKTNWAELISTLENLDICL